jgi:hypothetical protein
VDSNVKNLREATPALGGHVPGYIRGSNTQVGALFDAISKRFLTQKCPPEYELVRMGRPLPDDGGKFTCAPIDNFAGRAEPCLIYSYGSHYDFSWEVINSFSFSFSFSFFLSLAHFVEQFMLSLSLSLSFSLSAFACILFKD